MYNFRFGIRAIIVGIIDLMILLASIVIYTVWAAWAKPLTIMFVSAEGPIRNIFRPYISLENATQELKTGRVMEAYIGLSASVDIMVSVIQCGATIALIRTATKTSHPKQSLRIAWFWFILNVIIYALYIVWRVLDKNWITLPCGIILRGLLCYNVFKFIQELRKVSAQNLHGILEDEFSMARPKTHHHHIRESF